MNAGDGPYLWSKFETLEKEKQIITATLSHKRTARKINGI
jgi:hypothetical protein